MRVDVVLAGQRPGLFAFTERIDNRLRLSGGGPEGGFQWKARRRGSCQFNSPRLFDFPARGEALSARTHKEEPEIV